MVSIHCYCKNMVYECNDHICMLCVQWAIKDRLLFCYHYRHWWCKRPTPLLYVLCGMDKSVSPLNRLVTRHWLNNYQRRIRVQDDGDDDLCTSRSYAKARVMLTSTHASWPSNRQWTRTANSRVEVQRDDAGDHYTGGSYAHTTDLIASTQSDHLPIRRC